MHSLQSLQGHFLGPHFLKKFLNLLMEPVSLISLGNITQIFGTKYEVLCVR